MPITNTGSVPAMVNYNYTVQDPDSLTSLPGFAVDPRQQAINDKLMTKCPVTYKYLEKANTLSLRILEETKPINFKKMLVNGLALPAFSAVAYGSSLYDYFFQPTREAQPFIGMLEKGNLIIRQIPEAVRQYIDSSYLEWAPACTTINPTPQVSFTTSAKLRNNLSDVQKFINEFPEIFAKPVEQGAIATVQTTTVAQRTVQTGICMHYPDFVYPPAAAGASMVLCALASAYYAGKFFDQYGLGSTAAEFERAIPAIEQELEIAGFEKEDIANISSLLARQAKSYRSISEQGKGKALPKVLLAASLGIASAGLFYNAMNALTWGGIGAVFFGAVDLHRNGLFSQSTGQETIQAQLQHRTQQYLS